jgi:hypothetical protein
MSNRTKLLQRSDIYLVKQCKQPDHLLALLRKFKKTEDSEGDTCRDDDRATIKRRIMQKRIDAIMKNAATKSKVSQPTPYLSKRWVSPLDPKA